MFRSPRRTPSPLSKWFTHHPPWSNEFKSPEFLHRFFGTYSVLHMINQVRSHKRWGNSFKPKASP